jgi:hypothetical protein
MGTDRAELKQRLILLASIMFFDKNVNYKRLNKLLVLRFAGGKIVWLSIIGVSKSGGK